MAALLLVNSSCGDMFKETWEYLADNPLDKEITLQIDGKEYAIPAKTTKSIKLEQGKHTLTYNGASVNFVTKVNSNETVTLLNPTLSNYLLNAQFYVKEGAKNDDVSRLYKESCREYQSEEGTVELPVKVLNSLFIEKSQNEWMFGLDEDAREQIRSGKINPGSKHVFYKLYREVDYRSEMAEELPKGVVFPSNPNTLANQPVYAFPIKKLTSDCDAANEYFKEMGERVDNIIANPDDIFQEMGRLLHGTLMDLNSLDSECSTKNNPDRDDSMYKAAIKEMHKEIKYLSYVSTFITK